MLVKSAPAIPKAALAAVKRVRKPQPIKNAPMDSLNVIHRARSTDQSFLQTVVIPHAAIFGTLIVAAEIYVAIALVFGLTTRLAACVALFLLFNYMCAKGALPWGPGIDKFGHCSRARRSIQLRRPHFWRRPDIARAVSGSADLVNAAVKAKVESRRRGACGIAEYEKTEDRLSGRRLKHAWSRSSAMGC